MAIRQNYEHGGAPLLSLSSSFLLVSHQKDIWNHSSYGCGCLDWCWTLWNFLWRPEVHLSLYQQRGYQETPFPRSCQNKLYSLVKFQHWNTVYTVFRGISFIAHCLEIRTWAWPRKKISIHVRTVLGKGGWRHWRAVRWSAGQGYRVLMGVSDVKPTSTSFPNCLDEITKHCRDLGHSTLCVTGCWASRLNLRSRLHLIRQMCHSYFSELSTWSFSWLIYEKYCRTHKEKEEAHEQVSFFSTDMWCLILNPLGLAKMRWNSNAGTQIPDTVLIPLLFHSSSTQANDRDVHKYW